MWMRSGKEDGKEWEIMISEANKSFGIHITFRFDNPRWKMTRKFSVAIQWVLLATGTTVCP
jgi:hypothetical protein